MRKKFFLITFLIMISTMTAGCGSLEKKAMKDAWNKGKAYIEEEDYVQAIGAFQEALSHVGNMVGDMEFQIVRDKADAESKAGDYVNAIADYTILIELEIDLGEMYIQRGFAYDQTGDLEKALEDYQAAVAADPENIEVYNKIGDLLEQRGHTEEARIFRDTGAAFVE